MRHLGLMPWLLAVAAGCQSGRVEWAQFSADGNLVAFRDSRWQTVYIAHGRTVRAMGAGEFYLREDGRLLLVIEGIVPSHHVGDRVCLHDLYSGRHYTVTLPFEIPNEALRKGRRDDSELEQEGPSAAPEPRETVGVFFDESPVIAFGPLSGVYWLWNPSSGWRQGERPNMRRFDLGEEAQERRRRAARPWLVQLGPDGWNARRTVWVRPDCSTLELDRQNDVLPAMSGCILLSPFALVPPWTGFWLIEMAGQLRELEPDPAKDGTAAHLESAIVERRLGHAW